MAVLKCKDLLKQAEAEFREERKQATLEIIKGVLAELAEAKALVRATDAKLKRLCDRDVVTL
jgi:hypothetical protein